MTAGVRRSGPPPRVQQYFEVVESPDLSTSATGDPAAVVMVPRSVSVTHRLSGDGLWEVAEVAVTGRNRLPGGDVGPDRCGRVWDGWTNGPGWRSAPGWVHDVVRLASDTLPGGAS